MQGKKNVISKEFLMQRVTVDSAGHWIWSMARFSATGYGQIRAHGKNQAAHRVYYETFVGPIPKGMFVLHNCSGSAAPGDFYTRACCNPEHLYLGSHADNMRDMTRERRHSYGRRHWPKTRPESLATGDRNGSRTHPEARPRGDAHWSRQNPQLVLRGEHHPSARLTADDVRTIRARIARGATYASIAVEYGVTPESVSNLVRRKTWKHVT